jgi:hypothetical protein
MRGCRQGSRPSSGSECRGDFRKEHVVDVLTEQIDGRDDHDGDASRDHGVFDRRRSVVVTEQAARC